MSEANKGRCHYCNGIFSKTVMKKHLDTCNVRIEKDKPGTDGSDGETYFCILVQGFDLPEYWMYVDISANATLKVLDGFLRETWLECCGHLSSFEIAGVIYASNPDKSSGDKSMSIKLNAVLEERMQFLHEYDFGSTTTLKLKIVSIHSGKKRRQKFEIVARNLAPEIKCSKCGKLATQVCCECIYEEEGWLCDNCAETHECGEEMLLPVVNSPRVGVCAYCGNEDE